MIGRRNDDPRKLRSLLRKASDLARSHAVSSVVVGIAAREGDLEFPEFVDFLESALRVEDGIFRMTRERVVVHLADVDADRAREVLERLVSTYSEEYPSLSVPEFDVSLFEVTPGEGDEPSVRQVLTALFAPEDEEPRLH